MIKSMYTYKLANILVEEFDSSCIDDTVDNYANFVQEFAKQNGMVIYGKMVDIAGWSTEGYEFNTPEDELVFKLKYM